MDPLALIKLFLAFHDFSQGVSEYKKEDEELIEMVPIKYHAQIREAGLWILRLGYAGVFLFLIVLPLSASLTVYFVDAAQPFDAICRGLVLMSFFSLTFLLGAYTGIAIGVLTSPRWYMATDLGVRWRKLSGTNSVAGCRLVSVLVVIVSVCI